MKWNPSVSWRKSNDVLMWKNACWIIIRNKLNQIVISNSEDTQTISKHFPSGMSMHEGPRFVDEMKICNV